MLRLKNEWILTYWYSGQEFWTTSPSTVATELPVVVEHSAGNPPPRPASLATSMTVTPPDLEEPAVKEKKMERLAELAKTRGVMGAYGGLALRLRDLVESKPASLQKWQIKLPKIMKASSFHLGFGGFMEFTFQLLMFLVRRNGRQDTLIRDGSTNKEWFCSVSGPGLFFFEPAWWSLWMHGSLFQGLVFQI